MEYPVSFADRFIQLPSGEALIWPYLNVLASQGPYEFFVDCNSYRNPGWIRHLPKELGKDRIHVNLFPALSEEWLASAEFQKNPKARIQRVVRRYEEIGVCFPRGYASRMEKVLQKGSSELRYNWTILLFYIAINKKLLERSDPEEAMEELVRVSSSDVPRAGLMLSLCALSLFLKRNRDVKLIGEKKIAYSYVQRFFDFQTAQKGEKDYLTVDYLRNRGLDLAIYYFLPVTSLSKDPPLFEPVIVTKDVPFKQLIVRVLPFLYAPKYAPAILTSLAVDEFDAEVATKFIQWCSRVNRAFDAPGSVEQKRNRVVNLAHYAKSLCTRAEETNAIEEIWREWAAPYFDAQAQFAKATTP